MAYVRRKGGEDPSAISVIISVSGQHTYGSVGTVGGVIPRPGENIEYRSIEQPIERALRFAKDKAKGGDVIIDLDDDVEWDPGWGELVG